MLALLILLAFMYIISLMAAVTFDGEILFVEHALVTGCANQFLVFSLERKRGASAVIKPCDFPAVLFMAGVTFLSVASPVIVVMPVAAVTFFFGFFIAQCFCMTSLAGNILVFSCQFELGFPVMIEFGFVPVAGVVAILTFFAIASLVNIIQVVAGMAVLWCFLVFIINVATVAHYILMLSFQTELGLVMIEVKLFPGFCGMAITAFITQFSVVRVLFLMTVNAGG
jgi:hypothetical protein